MSEYEEIQKLRRELEDCKLEQTIHSIAFQQIVYWLEHGCSIRRADKTKPVLKLEEDGTWISNLEITAT